MEHARTLRSCWLRLSAVRRACGNNIRVRMLIETCLSECRKVKSRLNYSLFFLNLCCSGIQGVLAYSWPAEGALRLPELLCVTYAYCLSINVRSGLPNGVGRGSISLKRLQSDPFSAPRVPAVCSADDCLSPRHLWCGLDPGLCVSMPPNP